MAGQDQEVTPDEALGAGFEAEAEPVGGDGLGLVVRVGLPVGVGLPLGVGLPVGVGLVVGAGLVVEVGLAVDGDCVVGGDEDLDDEGCLAD